MYKRFSINISGIVQGVGFRPFVYRLANRLNLTGSVSNNSNGVKIEIQGEEESSKQFLYYLKNQPPPLAQITDIEVKSIPTHQDQSFRIIKSSKSENQNTLISPDIAMCEDCKSEVFNPDNRRYLYPFINCTNCGPRYTIISDIPYDRKKTSMSVFKMCPQCKHEYENHANRRFHAQPNACPQCGPQIQLVSSDGTLVEGNAIDKTAHYLLEGKIIAIKGLGGFHLAVDATNNTAVKNLRFKKHRFEKPLAIMTSDINAAQEIVYLDEEEVIQLSSLQRPIVLCKKKKSTPIAPQVSLDNDYFGLMLPYTPLHAILFQQGKFSYLVMTSANLSEEPICYRNEECLWRMKNIIDFALIYNRDIYTRCDDSVLRIFDKKSFFIRRSRGYAPGPVLMTKKGNSVLAVGGHIKNTICLTKEKYAFLSHHIGDLENIETLSAFESSVTYLQKLLQISPKCIIHDLHPDYISTKWVKDNANVPSYALQHHYAHILSVMGEHGLEEDVIGIALDGTGYGSDNAIWGGEILICNLQDFQRYAHLKYVPLPGGEKAIQEPWRMALSYLKQSFENFEDISTKLFKDKLSQIEIVKQMIDKKINSPLTSSCGRLFDAVAAILGIRNSVAYEGQAAILLEAQAERSKNQNTVDIGCFDIINSAEQMILDPCNIVQRIVDLKLKQVSVPDISKAFHEALIEVLINVVCRISEFKGLKTVALSGGCFQNMLLLSGTYYGLKNKGFEVVTNFNVPVNDGGIALGQAYWGMYHRG